MRLTFENTTTMWHPIHLHGHTFRVGDDPAGPRKDTVNVLPGETVVVEFDADNPGQWMVHCHNTYHLERGMAMVMSYVRLMIGHTPWGTERHETLSRTTGTA